MFKVDHLLFIFAFIVRQLVKTAETQDAKAEKHQRQINVLNAKKKAAAAESARANKIADKISELIS